MKIEIFHNPDERKFYTRVMGKESFITYRERNSECIELVRTYVPVEQRGKTIGSNLAEEAIKYAQKQNRKVIPTCEFVKWYVEHHPEVKECIVENNH